MKNVLFENVKNNQFRLLKEATNVNESLVASGVKKVFMNAEQLPISYNRIETVGMGYIKDINEAKQIALSEARILAREFGYKDNEDDARFVKDSSNSLPLKKEEHSETDMKNPEEKKEVTLAKTILQHTLGINNTIKKHKLGQDGMNVVAHCDFINQCVADLLKILGQQ